MTTEEDFQRQLDEHPDDFQTRLVFADFLQDRDDPRAEGYRALGVRDWFPYRPPRVSYWTIGNYRVPGCPDCSDLPRDWFSALTTGLQIGGVESGMSGEWVQYGSRREAEDAAALAFAKLPAPRRAELLSAVPA